jgi:hypothetical protein
MKTAAAGTPSSMQAIRSRIFHGTLDRTPSKTGEVAGKAGRCATEATTTGIRDIYGYL